MLEGQFTECSNSLLGWPLMHYFMSKDTCSQYDMREWEEVKPEWVDVTLQCSLLDGVRLWHEDSAIADLKHGFRFRKVCPTSSYPGECFIIEQRRS